MTFRRILRAALLTALCLGLVPLRASAAPAPPAGDTLAAIRAEPIRDFQRIGGGNRFGDLEFIGGLVFRSDDRRVKGISSIRVLPDGSRFLAVSDVGNWLSGTFLRDAEGRLSGFAPVRIAPLRATNGASMGGKLDADAESLAISGGKAFVGFERDHRIYTYALTPDPLRARAEPVALPFRKRSLIDNRGLETIAASPKDSPLAGALVAIAERSLDADGNGLAAIFGGARNGPFALRRDPEWDATDGAFLPDGDLLVLERYFKGVFNGLGTRIRRIPGETIRPRAVVDGPVIFQADLAQEIDNMEGIDVWTDTDGQTRILLVSDNNGNFLQRNLVLEFRLVGEADRAASITSRRTR